MPVRKGNPDLSLTVLITHLIIKHVRSFLSVRLLKQEAGPLGLGLSSAHRVRTVAASSGYSTEFVGDSFASSGASGVSFLSNKEIYRPISVMASAPGPPPNNRPGLIVSMSYRLASP